MKLIATVTLGTTSFLSFENIPQTFTDLKCVASFRSNQGSINSANMTINVGSGATHSTRSLTGAGSSVSSPNVSTTNAFLNQMAIGTNFTANTFNSLEIYFPNYAGSTQKSFSIDGVTENNATSSFQTIAAGLFQSTAPITKFLIDSNGATFIAGSTISLYGITKGSDGIVAAS